MRTEATCVERNEWQILQLPTAKHTAKWQDPFDILKNKKKRRDWGAVNKNEKKLPSISQHPSTCRHPMTASKRRLRHSRAAQLCNSFLGLRNDKNLQCGNSVDTTQHQRSQIWVLVAQTSIRGREEAISLCHFSSQGAKIVLILSISVHCGESNRVLIH